MEIETIKLIKEFGVTTIMVGFCLWLIKEVVLRMGKSLDCLTANIQSLTNRIESWNKESEIAHSKQHDEHEKMSERLGDLKK